MQAAAAAIQTADTWKSYLDRAVTPRYVNMRRRSFADKL